MKRVLRRTGVSRRRNGERRNGRIPFRRRFGKRRPSPPSEPRGGQRSGQERPGRRGFWKAFLAGAAIALVVLTALPLAAALAQEPGEDGWSSDEIEFQPPPLVPGRRLYLESLTVAGAGGEVVLRAATDLWLTVRAYGGVEGRTTRFYATTSLVAGERVAYDLPLDGPAPSLAFSWRDAPGQAGALSLDGERLPWPLPAAVGELCSVRVVSLGWKPGVVEGALASECVDSLDEVVDLQTVAGHASVTTTALLEAEVVAVAGTATVSSGTRETSVPLVASVETRFRLPVASGEGVHDLAIEAVLEAPLRIPLPPLVELARHPERDEKFTKTASVYIPAYGDTVTETIRVPHDDGTVTEHSVTASCYVPASTVRQDVVFTVVHEERIEATVTQRAPFARTRTETLALTTSVWADDDYRALVVPDPEPAPEPVRQTPATESELADWFRELGWEWVW